MSEPAVELSHVTKTFGPLKAVDDLSLTVPAGSVYGFIGPNGSGKTTTLRIISRIYIPDRGEVRVLGEARRGAANDRVFYLPEERAIYPHMRVREALQFFARIKGVKPSRASIVDWLDRVGLPGSSEQRMNQLSKGMAQKVQFLCAVICKPTLAMLDEPFGGLDPVNAVVLRDLIKTLRDDGTTVIFSTHDMRVAEEMCDRVVMIYRGKKVLDGTLDEIRATHGRAVIHVRGRGGDVNQSELPGVFGVHHTADDESVLTLADDADPQLVLTTMIARGVRLERFEIGRQSLQDVFVRIAAPSGEGMETTG